MYAVKGRGFTLIELLTVIAIIAILASITAVALPRALERAKIARMEGAFRNIDQAMTSYYAQSDSFPPSYGMRVWDKKDQVPVADDDPRAGEYYFLEPYLAHLGSYGNEDLHDEFSESYDTSRDNQISVGEYSPLALPKVLPTDADRFPEFRFNGSNGGGTLARLLNEDSRPFIYVPVNSSQFKRAQRYWVEQGDWYGETWDPTNAQLQNITFPPPKYDAYVLISVGPGGKTFGIVPTDPNYYNALFSSFPQDAYHILALRMYFMATRDLNQNGALDFHFDDRRNGEAELTYQVGGQTVTNRLPDPVAPDGYGPWIHRGNN